MRDLDRAAAAIAGARHLLIGAGAGIGVDSGLPDFRGPEGFWRAYPALRGYRFEEMANPQWFDRDPSRAWGFYGHRLKLYRDTVPHAGFSILLRWAKARDGFVFTSNVDGQFQAAGFADERVYEVHGTIHKLQCSAPCGEDVWPAKTYRPGVGREVGARGELPTCSRCGAVARPNVLMFGDWSYSDAHEARKRRGYERWRRSITPEETVVIELGAGTAVPTVRWESERLQGAGATLVRINPRQSHGPRGTIELDDGALAVLEALAERVGD